MPDDPQTPLLEQLMPAHDFGETHSRTIAAEPERVEAAIRAITPGEMPVARVLMAIRGITRRTGTPSRPMIDGMTEIGFSSLQRRPGRELVFGGIGQPWKLRGGESIKLADAEAFSGFARPGFVKMAFDFRMRPRGAGTDLETRTWIAATDPASRRRFSRYWLLIRPGSGLIRRNMLSAIARRAEAS